MDWETVKLSRYNYLCVFREISFFTANPDDNIIFIQGLDSNFIAPRHVRRAGSLEIFAGIHRNDTGAIMGKGNLTVVVEVDTVIHADFEQFGFRRKILYLNLRVTPAAGFQAFPSEIDRKFNRIGTDIGAPKTGETNNNQQQDRL